MMLIQSGRCDINSTNDSGMTPLHYASAEGELEVVKMLMQHEKSDVNSRDCSGWTPLHDACAEGK